MKNFKFLVLLGFLLIGCSPKNNKSAFYATKTDNLEFIKENNTSLCRLMDSESSFALFIYSNSCSSCLKARATLTTYVEETHYEIHEYEYSKTSFNALIDQKSAFKQVSGTPSLIIINKGNITYNFQPTLFEDYSSFKPIANQHFIESSAQKYSTFNAYTSNTKFLGDHYVAFINSQDGDYLKKFNEHYYPDYFTNKSQNFVIIDEKYAESGYFDNFVNYYNHTVQYENHRLVFDIKNGNIITTFTYDHPLYVC